MRSGRSEGWIHSYALVQHLDMAYDRIYWWELCVPLAEYYAMNTGARERRPPAASSSGSPCALSSGSQATAEACH